MIFLSELFFVSGISKKRSLQKNLKLIYNTADINYIWSIYIKVWSNFQCRSTIETAQYSSQLITSRQYVPFKVVVDPNNVRYTPVCILRMVGRRLKWLLHERLKSHIINLCITIIPVNSVLVMLSVINLSKADINGSH